MRNFKITVTNTFHNTEATLIAKRHYKSPHGHISARQSKRMAGYLCPSPGCTCGGHNTAPVDTKGNTYHLDYFEDGSANVVLDARDSDFD